MFTKAIVLSSLLIFISLTIFFTVLGETWSVINMEKVTDKVTSFDENYITTETCKIPRVSDKKLVLGETIVFYKDHKECFNGRERKLVIKFQIFILCVVTLYFIIGLLNLCTIISRDLDPNNSRIPPI